MAEAIGEDCELIELGSGSGLKTRLCSSSFARRGPICRWTSPREPLERSVAELARRFPALEIMPVRDDFTATFKLPDTGDPRARRVVYFPGSTIGNFSPRGRTRLLRSIARLVGDGGGLLIGFDLDKDESIVWPAYNDRRGISAAFNLNLLARINRELDADFDLAAFAHRADYLRARRTHGDASRQPRRSRSCGSPGRSCLRAGETIHTEDSYKYTLEHFAPADRRAPASRSSASGSTTTRYFCGPVF